MRDPIYWFSKFWFSRFSFSRFSYSRFVGAAAIAITALALAYSPASAEPVTLRHAVELALSHGTTAAIASADERKAEATYHEARNSYIPVFVLGSTIGKSFGFPLSLEGSAPSIVNLNTQSALFNPSLREFIRAAKTEAAATTLAAKDRRAQVIQETVLNYLELAQWEKQVQQLQTDVTGSQKSETAIEQRIHEGVDSEIERNKAKLVTARILLRLAEARGSSDVLRLKLSQLTGIPAQSIETTPDSIPALPPSSPQVEVPAQVIDNNPAVASAQEHARAQYLRAKGEHRALWPSVDFAGQYSRLAKFNNYDEFFRRFEPNNGSVGAVMRFPFLNFSQRARAEGADADALRARKEAEAAKDQVSAEALQLLRTEQQLTAARDVADLEYKIAQSSLDAVQTRTDSGAATYHELEDARTQARERRDLFLDADMQLNRARVGLLRSTGGLESWAFGSK
jgi:outer membrane protein TolC